MDLLLRVMFFITLSARSRSMGVPNNDDFADTPISPLSNCLTFSDSSPARYSVIDFGILQPFSLIFF